MRAEEREYAGGRLEPSSNGKDKCRHVSERDSPLVTRYSLLDQPMPFANPASVVPPAMRTRGRVRMGPLSCGTRTLPSFVVKAI